MSSLSDCYATVTTQFGAGGDFYVNGHRGADYRRTARQAIIAYDDMVVESRDYGSGLGWSIGLRRLTQGGFCGFAHVYGAPPVGARFKKGEVIALVAGYDDQHGSLWTGPHIHTTQGDVSAYNCSVGIRPLSDPAPVIARAIAGSSTASGSSRIPIPTPAAPIEEEEETMYPVIVQYPGGSKIFTIGKEFLKYEAYGPGAELTRNVLTTDDQFVLLSPEEFTFLLASMGIPATIPDIVSAQTASPDFVWSRARDTYERTEAILAKLNS